MNPTCDDGRIGRKAERNRFNEVESLEQVGFTRHATSGWVPSASLGTPSGSAVRPNATANP
jgi:hypothetical protein